MSSQVIDDETGIARDEFACSGFDIVIVPHGSVNQDLVVGSVGVADVASVNPRRIPTATNLRQNCYCLPIKTQWKWKRLPCLVNWLKQWIAWHLHGYSSGRNSRLQSPKVR
jgi:hypothetical protein